MKQKEQGPEKKKKRVNFAQGQDTHVFEKTKAPADIFDLEVMLFSMSLNDQQATKGGESVVNIDGKTTAKRKKKRAISEEAITWDKDENYSTFFSLGQLSGVQTKVTRDTLDLTVSELRGELRSRGLSEQGKKPELLERLEAAIVAENNNEKSPRDHSDDDDAPKKSSSRKKSASSSKSKRQKQDKYDSDEDKENVGRHNKKVIDETDKKQTKKDIKEAVKIIDEVDKKQTKEFKDTIKIDEYNKTITAATKKATTAGKATTKEPSKVVPLSRRRANTSS